MTKDKIKIAIVGAPNVGKSSFFNNLIGGRRAIVEDIEGITRDRIYADININKFFNEYTHFENVIFIDTGGLFFEKDSLFEGVQKQVELAVEESDCIIFMTDGRRGVTPIDKKIANLMRKHNKPIILLVNKLDSADLFNLSAEFYKLSLGDPISFSCKPQAFRSTIGALLERLEEEDLLKKGKEKTDTEDFPKIVLLGKPNTGKSSILNKIVGYERSLVHDVAGTTRDALDTELIYEDKKLLLIDTAGLRRKSKVYGELERFSVDRSIKGLVRADIAVLIIDATEGGISHQEKKLASLIKDRLKGCIIVINKWDLITEKDFEAYKDFIKGELNFLNYAPIVIVSAKTGQRIKNILDESLKVYENLHKKIKTNILNTAIREITALRVLNSKLKIYYATQSGVNPICFTVFVNDPKHFDPNYSRYIENSLRTEFGLEGVPIKWDVRKSENKSRN